MFSFYADESGSTGSGQGDFVVLLAIGFNDNNWKQIKDGLDGLKRRYFPHWALDDVELKSVFLRRWNLPDQSWPPNAFTTLTAAQINSFGADLYALIDALPFEWSAVCASKAFLLRNYGLTGSKIVFFRLYTYLLERLHGWCNREGTHGRFFLDQQHQQLVGATHDEIITRHRQLLAAGTGWQRVDRVVEQPFFMISKYSAHIQLADILAYNVMRNARDGGFNGAAAYPFFTRMMPKCRGYNPSRVGATPFGLKLAL